MQVPLDSVDPSRQSLLYTQGDQAAVTPIYDYDFSILYGAAAQSSWREILWCVGCTSEFWILRTANGRLNSRLPSCWWTPFG